MKQFFKQSQKLLLQLANSEAGRFLLGYKNEYPIVKIGPSSFHCLADEGKNIYQSRFFSPGRVAALFLPPLEKMRIMGERIEDRDEAFLHFTGLEPKGYKYPQIFLTTTSYYDDTGEGRVTYASGATWDITHDAAEGTGTSALNIVGATKTAVDDWTIVRQYSPVDTSGLPNNATISAAAFYAYRDDAVSAFADDDTTDIDLVQSGQVSATTLAVADYNNPGTTVTGSKAMSATSNGAYFSITLDATGRGWISKTSHTKLATRNSRDTDDADPTGSNGIAFQARGAANPIYLSVTYTAEEGVFLLNFI